MSDTPTNAGPACPNGTRAGSFPAGVFFYLVQIELPLSTQLQLFASFAMSATEPDFVGQVTNADRNPDLACDVSCIDPEICSPSRQACIAPSERAVSTEEYGEYVPSEAPPAGYGFALRGCLYDAGGGVAQLIHQPADLEVQSPPVSLSGLDMSGSFGRAADGTWRGSGSFTADNLSLGTQPIGPATGTHTSRHLVGDEVPAGVPPPPEQP